MLLLLLTTTLGVQARAFQQATKTIKGKVMSAKGEFLTGATVLVKGTTTATSVDEEGNFQIKAPADGILVVSYISYLTQEVAINNKSTHNIILKEDATIMDEVVVVGYGTQKKSHLTGSVAKLENENLEQVAVSRIDQAIQGQIAGVQIQNVTSEVGQATQVSIRGASSISAGNAPLVVIDGYPTQDGLDFINPASIESIEVLKDASSAAIYGSRGANGVILVTTKEGKSDKPRYEFQSYAGIKTIYKKEDVMDAYEYVDMLRGERQMIENANAARAGREPNQLDYSNREKAMKYIAEGAGGPTDWQEEGLRSTAKINSYLLNVSGGSSTINYFVSGQYVADEGLLKDNFSNRFNLQTRLSARLNKNVRVGINLKPSYNRTRRSTVPYADYTRTHTWSPVRHNEYTSRVTGRPVGSYAHGRHYNNINIPYTDENGVEQILNFPGNLWGTANNSAIARMENEWRFQEDYRIMGNAFVQWELAKNLSFRSSVGSYLTYRNFERFRNGQADQTGMRIAEDNTTFITDYLMENTLTHKWEKGKHEINSLAGYTYQTINTKFSFLEGSQQPTDYISTVNAATSINLNETYSSKLPSEVLISYLGRVNYAYDDRYLLSLVLRTDGSSRFGDDHKFGWFPSASVGWNVANENFWTERFSKINMMKMRASIGMTGNNRTEPNIHINTLRGVNYVLGEGNGNLVQGLGQVNQTIANENIRWERTLEMNYGLDAAFLANRFTLTADYYHSVTDKLLLKQNITGTSGYINFWNNTGRIENRGVELSANAHVLQIKDFTWQLGGNISGNRNRILSLGGEPQFINQGERQEQYLSKVGERMVMFYGYKMIGVWQSWEEIAANPSSAEDMPGGIRVADINGDGIIDADDRTNLGNPFPDFIWGVTNRMNWKGFDLNVLLQGSQGGKVFNGDGFYTETRYLHKDFTEGRWVSEDYPASKPLEKNGRAWEHTDYLIQDASYISLRSVILGYTLPATVTSKAKLTSARVYFSGYNLLYFMGDNYTGLNPEGMLTSGTYNSPLMSGYQRGAYPIQRTYTLGVDIKF